LLFAAWQIWREDPNEEKSSGIVDWLARHVPVSSKVEGEHFFTREGGRLMATPLMLALIAVELSDIVFAIDSVPAAFSVTTERFLVYSANAFAIVGLRSLYIATSAAIAQLRYLHVGLAVVLAFAGFKLLASSHFHISPMLSVGFILFVLGVAIWRSLTTPKGGAAPG
jgi:tellurite resistance protein TerC